MLITFLLAGFGLIAMHLWHRNLVGAWFASGRHRRCLCRRTRSAASDAGKCRRLGAVSDLECDVEGLRRAARRRAGGGATARADIALPLERRGRFWIERIKLSTAFPFGLFRAWT